ncbi:MAG: transporter [Rhizobiaceae bacterium]|nr:transporter [Rhizobiaceae bacterium]
MPPAAEIQRSLFGAWRMMTGRADGLRLLDLSADGFWNSFFAIAIALPALAVNWVSIANDLSLDPGMAAGRGAILLRLAMIDLGSWIFPLGALALAARPAGIEDRFVAYVVASNWGSAITVWLMLPPALLRLLFPGAGDAAVLISLLLFGATMVLAWRLTNAAIGRGPGVATAVFAGMFFASLLVFFALEALFGLAPLR